MKKPAKNNKSSRPLYETKRIQIEEAILSDSKFILELLNSPGWIEFIGDRGIKSESDAKNYIQTVLINSYEKNNFGLFKMILKAENKPIGVCGFIKRDFLEHADIGFALLPEYEGKGYAFEAATETMNFGKTNLQLNTILAITTPENIKSKNLLIKIGLREIGTIHPDIYDIDLLLFSNEYNQLKNHIKINNKNKSYTA